ncbi:MAG: septal ring lytic transglycosylase RlpA family protein [Deltaproteobacteria bacterium]|nr:septal ring lytic transglycosylase RlpA family protein [Deltaproteobacteria bacterium]MBW2136421.1 septal ring lytic transglycosylase RlpA family protein [Deltaproteobacteria bacterium]
MKKCTFIYLAVIIGLFGCTPRSTIQAPSSRTILLPEDRRGRLPRPYEVNGKRYYPLPDAFGFTQVGNASWYGEKFHGRPTASGEIFDMHKRTAAHKTLPLGTFVKVMNLSNNRSTFVRVNDRGPFVKGRIIDLSYAAAREIDLIRSGVARVKIEALSEEVGKLEHNGRPQPLVEVADLGEGEFTIQVGAFLEIGNAMKLAERLRVIFDYVEISPILDENRRTLHRVHVTKSKTLNQAEGFKKKLEEMGLTGAFIVRI